MSRGSCQIGERQAGDGTKFPKFRSTVEKEVPRCAINVLYNFRKVSTLSLHLSPMSKIEIRYLFDMKLKGTGMILLQVPKRSSLPLGPTEVPRVYTLLVIGSFIHSLFSLPYQNHSCVSISGSSLFQFYFNELFFFFFCKRLCLVYHISRSHLCIHIIQSMPKHFELVSCNKE